MMSTAMEYKHWRCSQDGDPLTKCLKIVSTFINLLGWHCQKDVQIVDPSLSTREVDETETETGEDYHDNYDHSDPEAEEGRNRIENLHQMNANMHKCLFSVFKIGLACSLESPQERTNTENVSRELHHVKNAFLGIGIYG